MSWIIKDTYTKEYFICQPSTYGWFHPDIERARTYLTHKAASKVLAEGGHHITWPGNRILSIVKVRTEEVYDDQAHKRRPD